MQIKMFLAFIRKEFLHILRDSRTMMVVLLLPILLMVLFGFAITNEIKNINIAVVSDHRTPAVREAVERLANNPYITFVGYVSESELNPVLRSGKANGVVVFAQDYDRLMLMRSQSIDTPAPIQVVLDASDASLSATVAAYVQGVINSQHSTLNSPYLQIVPSGKELSTHLRHNPQMKSSFNFVPGIMGLVFILICAIMTSVSIVKEKETGTMEVLLVSPVKPILIIIAKLIPYFVLSLVNLATILLLARFLLEVPLSGSMTTLLFVSVVYLVLALSLGLFISTVAQKQIVALLVSAVVMMVPVLMLSGMVFPIENMPIVIRPLTTIVPARWYIAAMRKLMIEGLGFASVWRETLILIAMTVIVLTAALKKFNDKLE